MKERFRQNKEKKMKHRKIYDIIRERSPISVCDDPELLEQFEDLTLEELMQDLEALYQDWGMLPKLYRARKKEDLQKIGECESLWAFILEAIFSYGDTSVIPQLLKYVPSDDEYEDEDLVFLEDYSSQPLCNGITEADYFGEAYIPILLTHIHELLPKKIEAASSFLYDMLLDDLYDFKDTHPLFNHLHLVQKKSFMMILDFSLNSELEESSEDKKISIEELKKEIASPITGITYEDPPFIKVAYLRQEFLKLHATD